MMSSCQLSVSVQQLAVRFGKGNDGNGAIHKTIKTKQRFKTKTCKSYQQNMSSIYKFFKSETRT